MTTTIRNVLVVGVEAEFHRNFEQILKRRNFDVDRVAEPGCALALIEAVAIDVLVLRYPMFEPTVEELIEAIRRPGSPCRRSAVLILASDDDLGKAGELAEADRTQVLPIDSEESLFQETVSNLLRATPRMSVRITIRLEALLDNGSTMLLTQTENVSRGGMLVKVRKQQPIDAKLNFELLLPEDSVPVRGRGQVVRHTRDWRGDVTGVGIKFSDFEQSGDDRLREYLHHLG